MLRLRIGKCHGSGNDFPMIDARDAAAVATPAWTAAARALADRAGPVGGDGLLLLTGSADAPGFRMFNSDGSEAETCLNGVRCVARAAFALSGTERATLALARGGEVAVARAPELAPGVHTVRETAAASLDTRRWPLGIDADRLVDTPLPRLDPALAFTAVAMPNPHLVAFVEAVDEDALVRLGLACEAAPDWLPNRANVSFAVVREGGLYVRTHERGVGLTDSCGSAMAAATYAACVTGRVAWGSTITVWNRGGLVRAAADAAGSVTIEGNATFEWEGRLTLDPATGAVGAVTVERRFPREIAAWEALLSRAAR